MYKNRLIIYKLLNMEKQINSNRYFRMNFFELISIVISIAGFIIVILTLKDTENTLTAADSLIHAGLSSQMSNWTIEIDKSFIQHPELRPYFYDNIPIDTNSGDYRRACNIAELMLDGFDAVMGNQYYKLTVKEKDMWRKWIFACFKQSPILRQIFDDTRDWYSAEIGEIYHEYKMSMGN